MEYELKAKKWFFVGAIIFMTVLFLISSVVLIEVSGYDPLEDMGYPVLAQKSICDYPEYLVALIALFAMTVFVDVMCIKTLRQKLTFNNVNFTVNGVTYTYAQIEKVRFGTTSMPIGRYRSVPTFQIYVNGKSVYNYNEIYEGFKEFHYYLDYYKVPVTPN